MCETTEASTRKSFMKSRLARGTAELIQGPWKATEALLWTSLGSDQLWECRGRAWGWHREAGCGETGMQLRRDEEAERSAGLERRCKRRVGLFAWQKKITCRLAWAEAWRKENGGKGSR